MKTQILIDSRNRSEQTNNTNNFKVYLNNHIKNLNYIRLLYAHIPATYYNITSSNNIIDFDEGGGALIATVTPGFYNDITILQAIKTALDSAGGDTYTVTYDYNTFKLTISSTGTFSLLFSSGTNTLIRKVLGFNQEDKSIASSQVSDNSIDLTPNKYIYIYMPQLGINGQSTNGDPYTFIVPVQVNGGAINIYAPNTNFNQFRPQQRRILTEFEIELRDDNGLLDLNNSEWYMIFELE